PAEEAPAHVASLRVEPGDDVGAAERVHPGDRRADLIAVDDDVVERRALIAGHLPAARRVPLREDVGPAGGVVIAPRDGEAIARQGGDPRVILRAHGALVDGLIGAGGRPVAADDPHLHVVPALPDGDPASGGGRERDLFVPRPAADLLLVPELA